MQTPSGSSQLVRRPTGTGTRPGLQRFPSMRRGSFLVDLQDQLQSQLASEQERERLREVAAIHCVLNKSPETRDAQDIDVLYDWVLRNGSTNNIFHGAQEIICKTICREMTLLELPPTGVVCYQGDFGDTFFIIITGSVSLFIDSKAKLRSIDDELGKPERSDQYFRGLQKAKGDHAPESDDPQQQQRQYGSFIKQITSGGTFGELAVLDPTARRSCTVVCDVETSFICLKRGAYQRLIRITNSSQLDFTPTEFLESLFFFEEWPHGELTRLSNRLRHLYFPADTFLTRAGSEANVMYFIYSGTVQESLPLMQFLNDNGTVQKCAPIDSKDPHKHKGKDFRGKNKYPARKVALELNVYQDHDICGEYPVLFGKALCNTDLLAVTDVKALIMDRETWKELFYMHGLEHILGSYTKFIKIAQARENWRKIRMKLALANPTITLSLTTKEMMQDGKCMCGWCGKTDHITGDPSCVSMIASKKKEADRAKRPRRPRKMLEMGLKALAVKNTVNFVSSLAESAGVAPTQPVDMTTFVDTTDSNQDKEAPAPSPPPQPAASPRLTGLALAARHIVAGNTTLFPDSSPSENPATAAASSSAQPNQVRDDELASANAASSNIRESHNQEMPRKDAICDQPALYKASRHLYTMHQHALERGEPASMPDVKVEDIRKGAFTEGVESQYKQEMLKKVKRLTTMKDYYGVRGDVLDRVAQESVRPPEERYCSHEHRLPRKPKIPKPNRRINAKTRQPRPDRFNRKINRVLKKMWIKDHPLPIVEESLRD